MERLGSSISKQRKAAHIVSSCAVSKPAHISHGLHPTKELLLQLVGMPQLHADIGRVAKRPELWDERG